MKAKVLKKKNDLIERNKLRSRSKTGSNCGDIPLEGRRLVHLKHLSKQLICKSCNADLLLRGIENEQEKGLASILTVRCQECLEVTDVSTDTQTVDKKTGRVVFTSNLKLGLGEFNHVELAS